MSALIRVACAIVITRMAKMTKLDAYGCGLVLLLGYLLAWAVGLYGFVHVCFTCPPYRYLAMIGISALVILIVHQDLKARGA